MYVYIYIIILLSSQSRQSDSGDSENNLESGLLNSVLTNYNRPKEGEKLKLKLSPEMNISVLSGIRATIPASG